MVQAKDAEQRMAHHKLLTDRIPRVVRSVLRRVQLNEMVLVKVRYLLFAN